MSNTRSARAIRRIARIPVSRRFSSRKSLFNYCVRRTIERLRTTWSGSSASLKRSVRKLLLPYRKNPRFLAGILQILHARSVAALIMAAILCQPAFADQRPVEFVETVPLTGIPNLGSNPSCAPGDLDGDGDLDFVIGNNDGSFSYFENVGTAIEPAFTTGSLSGLTTLSGLCRAALGDIDHDGDLDLVTGELNGPLAFFRNTGTVTAPAFATTSFPGLTALPYASAATFADLDGDGDLDILAGNYYQNFVFFENTGPFHAPVFVSTTLSGLDLSVVVSSAAGTPTVGDVDGDGDLDVFAGEVHGRLAYFENTGTPVSPAFAASVIPGTFDVGGFSAPALADIDRDGDLDLLVGNSVGELRVFEFVRSPYSFVGPGNTTGTLPGLGSVGSYSSPAFGDVYDDGDLDVVSGDNSGNFDYYSNEGSATTPSFTTDNLTNLTFDQWNHPTFGDLDNDGDNDILSGSFNGEFFYLLNDGAPGDSSYTSSTLSGLTDVGHYSAPCFADIDADGDLDVISGDSNGNFIWFNNTGTPTSPAFTNSSTLPGTSNSFFQSTPAVGDFDRDGDLDIFSGEYYGTFFYFENTGTAVEPSFRSQSPLFFPELFGRSTPAAGDVDHDGDLDILAGNVLGNFVYFQVAGAPKATPLFTKGTLPGLAGVGDNSAPAFGDLNGDGDIDMLSGRQDGSFVYFENTGSITSPGFSTTTLGGLADIGLLSIPVLGDMDGDGDLDLLVGSYQSDFVYFENTGSPSAPAFGPSTSLPGLGPVTDFAAPALGDLDADGDLDFVGSAQFNTLFFAENTGSPTSPAFAATTTLPGFFDVYVGAAPHLQDVDGDGDIDLVVGGADGTFTYLENTGSAWSPEFTNNRLAKLGDIGYYCRPAFADLDADGDLDCLAGEDYGEFIYFQNTSRYTIPRIAEGDRIKVHALKNGAANAFPLNLSASEDLDHELTWSIYPNPAQNGTASVSGTGTSKAINYAPNTDYTGPDVFLVRVISEHGRVDYITILVEVVDADAEIDDLRDNFDTYDDGDGELTEAEILAAYPNFLLDLIHALDSSGDGEVTLAELVKYAGFPPSGSLATAYVDFNFAGTETGEPATPFDTLFEGIFNVQANGTVEIEAGSSSETMTINKAVQLRSSGGTATIGQQP